MTYVSAQICGDCWEAECVENGTPGREPVRVIDAEEEPCALCGASTSSGIFLRLHESRREVSP